MKQLTVKNLRQNGFKVRVLHVRKYDLNGVSCKGGRTIVQISKDGNTGEGESVCSDLDNYNKRLGVRIALGRAYKALQIMLSVSDY
jgi:hypothetical protein